jgi:hypothetical protein
VRGKRKTQPGPGRMAETVPEVKPGDVDPMSKFARRLRLNPCTTSNRCTRASGHDESEGHPAALHVNVNEHDIVREVWRA